MAAWNALNRNASVGDLLKEANRLALNKVRRPEPNYEIDDNIKFLLNNISDTLFYTIGDSFLYENYSYGVNGTAPFRCGSPAWRMFKRILCQSRPTDFMDVMDFWRMKMLELYKTDAAINLTGEMWLDEFAAMQTNSDANAYFEALNRIGRAMASNARNCGGLNRTYYRQHLSRYALHRRFFHDCTQHHKKTYHLACFSIRLQTLHIPQPIGMASRVQEYIEPMDKEKYYDLIAFDTVPGDLAIASGMIRGSVMI